MGFADTEAELLLTGRDSGRQLQQAQSSSMCAAELAPCGAGVCVSLQEPILLHHPFA